MLRLPIRHLPYSIYTWLAVSFCDTRSQSKQCRSHSRVQMYRLHGWCAALFIILSGCLIAALSGCGGNIVSGGEQGTLVASPNSVDFGSVSVGETASNTVSLVNGKSTPVEISQVNLTGQSFSVAAPASLPVTLAAGQSYNLNVQFNPGDTGDATGQLTFTSSSSSSTNDRAVVGLTGTGMMRGWSASLKTLSCGSASMTGAGNDACTVTLNSAAPSSGVSVRLSSSNTAVTVPATVTVAAKATSATFTAKAAPVTTAQTATLTAVASGVSKSFALGLKAVASTSAPTLSVTTSGSPSSFGSAVAVTVTISSGPTGAVTFYDASTAIGTGTLNGTTATLTTSSLTAGSHTITANWPGNSSYSAVTSSAITQVVNKVTPTITWATPAAIAYGTALSATQLDASSSVAGSFSYSPAAGTVLTAGSHTIMATFTPTNTTNYATATGTVSITVTTGAPTITWATPAAIAYGTALSATQLNASSSVAGTFSYSPAVGTVLAAGSHTITATFTPTDTTDYATATGTVSITVTTGAPVITWATPAAIAYGTALSATQLDASSSVAGTFTYSPAVGTVLAAGSHTITATFTPTNTTNYTTATATVSITVTTGAPTITWATPAAIAYGTALSATQLDASSSVAGSFSYSPAAGTVLTAGSHTIMATFTPTNTTNYATATGTVSITVTTGAPTITWATPAAIAYGTALSATQLNASSSVAGTFSYSPAVGTVLAAGSHTITATFTPTDTTDYATATGTVSITVTTGAPTITWATPAAIAYGTALSATQLDASSSVAGSFTYSPAVGTVLAAGSHTITATFTPTNTTNYTTATATVSVTVTTGTPVITWATPAAIAYGTALSATQLNASSSVAGTFSYSPAVGTVLAAGSHTITATFTPTNTADYSTATQTVTLTVSQGTSTLGISATSLAFGSVTVNSPSTQSVTLTSIGTGSVTISAAAVTGTGFTVSGVTFPVTLASSQTATLEVQFDPTTAGAATGQLTITSNSSTNSTAVITLSGTGTAAFYAVNLSWEAPTSSVDPVAGYNVYRAPSGSSTYALLNSSPETETSYMDSTVVNGQIYDYIAESVDASGIESIPSNVFTVSIP